MYRFTWTLCLLFLLPASTYSHSEYKSRYVAENGKDHSGCDSPLRPCKTIAYAASRAVKGEKIFVAGGVYSFENVQDLYYITSGTVQAFGGYNRYEHFQKQAPDKNPTHLVGVPLAYRALLETRGFSVIADGKSFSKKTKQSLDEFVATNKRLESSKGSVTCIGGSADLFSCNNMDLLSQVSTVDLGALGSPPVANDIWGFVDLNTEREYAFVGFDTGTAVVDVTQPDQPRVIGDIPGQDTVWRDIKVYQFYDSTTARWIAYAYVTADGANDGIVIIDLTDLPNRISLAARENVEASAHNVYISNVDYTTGLPLGSQPPILYTAGANLSGGAFRGYGIDNPTAPAVVEVANSGYMHDASSLVIDDSRKDTQCANAVDICNILVDFNELSFQLWDVTNTGTPVQLSNSDYANVSYVHSGWWSEDKQFIFVQDELDELNANLNTTLRVFDVSDLLNPILATTWTGSTTAIDHNGFVKGNRYYMSNYTRGITVLDITDPTNPVPVGFFDTFPLSNRASFDGAWGAYPYLPSGNIIVSDDARGLFVLRDNTRSSLQGQLGFEQPWTAVTEGATATISVARSAGSAGAVSVDYWVLSGSTGDADVQSAAGTLNWGDGDSTNKVLSLQTNADGETEDVERLFVRLSNPRGGATLTNTGTSVFVNDAGRTPIIQFMTDTVAVRESTGIAMIVVQRKGSAQGQVTVDYQTLAGTATAGVDFVANNGTLSWADGDATGRVIPVTLVRDPEAEGNEDFSVQMTSPVGATLVNASLEVTITSQAPMADAGPDMSVNERTQVTLSGSQSNDPDGGPLTYLWTQIAGRTIPTVDANTANVTLVIPDVGQTELTSWALTVTDQEGLSDMDTVSVTINNVSNTAVGGRGGGGGRADPLMLLLLLTLIILGDQRVLATGRKRV